jgi:ribosomal protein S6
MCHYHPDEWDNPEVFDPERFQSEKSEKRHKFAYMPFGAGQRKCIGMDFALMEGQLALAMVAQRYTLTKTTEHLTEPQLSTTLRPKGGVVVKAETMGKRQLAYEILHHKDGTFVLLEIEGSGREIAELERRMRVNDRVLRYITVRVDEDRRRAEKLKDRRARKAAKRPAPGEHRRRGAPMEFAEASSE